MAEANARGPKLGVRIRPDTTGFAAELKAKMTAAEKKQGPLRVQVIADVKGFEEIKPRVTVDAKAIEKAIGDQVRKAATIRFKAEIDEASFRSIGEDLQRQVNRVQAELKRLKEQAEAAGKAQEETAGTDTRSTVTVDADTAPAEAQIAAAARNRRSTINVFADTAKAEAAVTAMLTRLSGARVATDTVRSLGESLANLDRSVPKMGGVAVGIAGIGGAAVSAIGAVTTLGASLGALAGVAGTLPATVGALGSMGATLLTVFNGMGTALGALGEAGSPAAARAATTNAAAVKAAYDQVAAAQEDAAVSAAGATRAIRNAREALALTVKSTAEATKAAAEDVVRTAKTETRAHRDVANAQRALTQARKDASRQLKDLDSQLKGAVLDSRELEQNLVDARQAYAEALTDPTRGQGALDALKLQADRAAQAVQDNRRKVAELTTDKAAADKAGISGAEKVLSAEQSLADARERQADAIKAAQAAQASVADTEVANARKLRDAREALTDAQDGAARSAVQSSRAQEAAAAALVAAQTAATTQAVATSDAMEALSPSAREAARTLNQVREQLGQVREAAQEAFFAGFSAPLKDLATTLMPQLKAGMADLAGAMGDGWATTMRALSANLGGGVLEGLLGKTAEGARAFNGALAPAVSALTTLGVVGADYLPRMGAAIADMTGRFSEFVAGAAADGSLDAWIEDGITAMKDLGSVIGSTASMFGSINQAALAAGGPTLSTFADGLARVAELMDQEPFQGAMTAIFRGANDAMGGIGQALGSMGDLLVKLAPTIEVVLGKAGEAIAIIAEGIGAALGDPAFAEGFTAFFDGLLEGLNGLLPVMPLVGQLLGTVFAVAGELAAILGPVLGEAIAILAPLLDGLLVALMPLIEALGPLLVGAINMLRPSLGMIGGALTGIIDVVTAVAKTLGALISGDFEGFVQGLLDIGRAVMEIPLKMLTGFLDGMAGFFNGIDLSASGQAIIGGLIDGLAKGFSDAAKAVQDGMAWLRGFFPNSPAKRGPFSGSGWTRLKHSGAAIGDQFASGLGDTSAVDAAAEDLMRSAGIGGTVTVKGKPGTAAAGLGSSPTINVYEAINARATATEAARLMAAGV